jgi:uncharacterized protein (TIGR00730 family)
VGELERLCVFCGSHLGEDTAYQQSARSLGRHIAASGIQLVYGGADVGLMGWVAHECLAAGGQVIGVMPGHLADMEVAHQGLTELIIVEDMHERKQVMSDLADGFVALPGGIGTLEETFEMFTWLQLGLHLKPLGILNVNDYYRHLILFLETMVSQGFLARMHLELLMVDTDEANLLTRLAAVKLKRIDKWYDREKNRVKDK